VELKVYSSTGRPARLWEAGSTEPAESGRQRSREGAIRHNALLIQYTVGKEVNLLGDS
jgi:hypothetical protein